MKIATEYFFNCPKCAGCDGSINIGPGHWFYCSEHKTRYCVGSNLFSSWKDETEEEQRKHYDELRFHTFEDVEPLCEGTPIFSNPKHLNHVLNETVQYAVGILTACLAAIEKASASELAEAAHDDPHFGAYPERSAGAALVSDLLLRIIAEKRRQMPITFSVATSREENIIAPF